MGEALERGKSGGYGGKNDVVDLYPVLVRVLYGGQCGIAEQVGARQL